MSSNQRFKNIMNYFNSDEDDNEKESKNKKEKTDKNNKNKNVDYSLNKKDYNKDTKIKTLESQIKYNNNVPRNSKDENILEKININYFDNTSMNSDKKINEYNDNNKENNKDILKNSLNKNINNNNSNLQEKEISLLDSFRPRQEPNSPEFIKKSSTEFNYLNNDSSQKNKKNNFNINNNNNYIDNNFSQTLETKIIISNNPNKKNQKNEKLITVDSIINGNKSNNNHNNVVSIGTFASKEIEDNISKTSEELEKQREEEFLLKEDLKIKKYNNQTKEEENGKENVIDDDDEDNENKDEINNKFVQPKFSRNIQNYNIYNSETQNTMPNRIKDMSRKLFQVQDKNNNINYNPDTENGKNSNENNINNINIAKQKEKKYETNYNSAKKNIINKIPVIKKTGIKYNNKNSPSLKKINININNNNTNYNSEFKDSSINSFNIYSSKNNLISTKGVYSKKNINQKELKNIKKKLIYSGKNPKRKENKIIIKKEEILSKTPIKQRKSENKKQKFTFTPLINKKSRKLWEKRNEKLEEMKSAEKDIKSNYSSNSNKKNKKPIYILLNELGNKQKEKMKQIYLTEKNNIKLNANIKKSNENCYDMYKSGMNKKIDNIIKKYVIDDELSIVNIVQCLCSMRIINELIKFGQINDLNINIIETAVKNIKERDKKKLDELNFIEQIWFIINPSLKENINCKLFSELIKKLYICDNSQIKICAEEIENELKENINETNKEKIYMSPLRDKAFAKNEIWSIQKLIKSFLKLKSDLKAYKNNYYLLKKEDLKNDLSEIRDKELTFEPDLSKSNYVFKDPKYEDYNIKNDDLNKTYTNISSTRKSNFNKIYERMMNDKKIQEEILKKMKLIKEVKEQKKCTLKPQILKYKPRRTNYLENRMNKSVDITNINQRKKIPIYERLYSLRKIYNQKKIKLNDDNNNDNSEIENKFNSKRSFNENEKNLKLNSKNKSKEKIKEKNEINNYAIKNKNLNINKNMNKAQIYSRKIQKMKIRNNNSIFKENGNNNIIDNIYVIIEIKTPKGDKKPIKIYKNQNDINDVVEKFCKENKINNENKDIIYNKVAYYQDNIFGRNTYKNNFEDNTFSEYRETKTNSNN